MNQSKFDLKFILVFSLCLICAFSGSALLYFDLNSSSQSQNGQTLATLKNKQSTVRRKSSNSLIWSNLNIKEPLYKKDSVHTGSNSTAVIELKNNNVIELSENSLVVIDDSRDLSLNFLKGSIILKSNTGDQKITVDEKGNQKVQNLSVKLIKPESFRNLFTTQNLYKIEFNWGIKENIPNQLQISKDKLFKNVITSQDVSNGSANIDVAVGSYFWRIVSKNEPISTVSKFTLTKVSSPKVISPAQNQNIINTVFDSNINFRWNTQINHFDNESIQNEMISKIIISKDNQFKQIIKTVDVNHDSGNASITGLTNGFYFWKLVTKISELTLDSNVESFQVTTNNKVQLTLESPQNNFQALEKKQIYFTWSKVSDSAEYELKVYERSTEIYSKIVKSLGHAVTFDKPANLTWKVFVKNNNQTITESETRSLKILDSKPIELVKPKDNENIFYWNKPTLVTLEWKSVTSSSQYLIEVSTQKDFKTILKQFKNDNTDQELESLMPGQYFWRISEVDPSNNVLRKSAIYTFQYGMHPILTASKLITPKNDFSVNPLIDKADIEFTWNEIENAKKYEFIIYENKSRSLASLETKTVLYKKSTSDTKIQLSNEEIRKLKSGNLQWSVRAIDELNRNGEYSIPNNLNITYGQILAPPEVLSPEVQ